MRTPKMAADESASWRSGTCVTPSLRLVRQLGEGGMGCVWVADHLALETQVAVKFILPENDSCDRLIHRLAREASLAAQVRNPHAVQVFDFGKTEAGTAYIVMELLDGENLAERLARTGTLSLAECGSLLGQVGMLLQRAHELDIVHRDLKPANLFLSQSGYDLFVKVLDFGVAKQVEQFDALDLTDSAAVVGTPFYMSPEAIRGTVKPNEQFDLWALAVVAYQALTGSLPFKGSSFGEQTLLLHDGAFVPASRYNPELPPAIDTWFARAFAKSPGDRFTTADQMVGAFLRSFDNDSEVRPMLWSHPPSFDATPHGLSEEALTAASASPAPVRRRAPWTLLSAVASALAVWGALTTSPAEPPRYFARQPITTVRENLVMRPLQSPLATRPTSPDAKRSAPQPKPAKAHRLPWPSPTPKPAVTEAKPTVAAPKEEPKARGFTYRGR